MNATVAAMAAYGRITVLTGVRRADTRAESPGHGCCAGRDQVRHGESAG
jgi:hypothetical protein